MTKKKLKVLVACEFSGTVRDAFRKLGHDAWSCGLLPTDKEGPHIQEDVLRVLNNRVGCAGYSFRPQDWDLIIAHPPCTHLSVSGANLWAEKVADGRQQAAIEFCDCLLYTSPSPRDQA